MNALSGAAISPTEEVRLMKMFPKLGEPKHIFKQKLDAVKNRLKMQLALFEKQSPEQQAALRQQWALQKLSAQMPRGEMVE